MLAVAGSQMACPTSDRSAGEQKLARQPIQATPFIDHGQEMREAGSWTLEDQVKRITKLLLPTVMSMTALTGSVRAETSVLQSLPHSAQKIIEDTRAGCKELDENKQTSGDEGLVTFTLGGKQAVLIDPMLLCNGCHAGLNCSNRGTRVVEVYVRRRSSWEKVLSNGNITGDIFVSSKPGYKETGQELNALVVDLFLGNKDCPTRIAASQSEQSYEARSCVLRWNGIRFTYKPL